MNEKLIKELRNMPNMTIQKFLSKYYNICCSNAKITHQIIECLFGIEPCLKIDNINEESIEEIIKGNIVLVIDGENRILGYKNPFLDKELDESRTLFNIPMYVNFKEDKNNWIPFSREDLASLEVYELEVLLKLCKKRSDDVTKRIIIDELHKRKALENNTKEEILEKVRKRELRKE